jgi:hypothetical protein
MIQAQNHGQRANQDQQIKIKLIRFQIVTKLNIKDARYNRCKIRNGFIFFLKDSKFSKSFLFPEK